ncbi:MAG: ABC transporter permease [Chloroflexi bacterium]|nr:ABC transporter permease [Chloroflexota bacterium]
MSTAYIVRRAVQALFTLFIVITLNFFLPRLTPGDPAARFYDDPRVSIEMKQQILKEFGLDKNLPEQFVIYLQNLARGDLGVSYCYRRPVMDVILGRIPWTLALTGTSTLIAVVLGAILGAYGGWHRGGKIERAILGGAIAFSALPSFWLALLLLLVFAYYAPLFPLGGMIDPGVSIGLNVPFIASVTRHAILPLVSMTLASIIGYAILVRSSMIEVIGSDYIVVARSKGLNEQKILFRHALRNALLPLVTSIGMKLSALIGGAVIIETIFRWTGMGLLVVESARDMDYPLMQGVFLILASITIVGNLLADVTYSWFDPRVVLK